VKKESDPPICGVHEVSVVQRQIPIDPDVPFLGVIPCYVCPVGHQVLADPERSK
jgi:hypothetical protein